MTKKSILIAEDNQANRLALGVLLDALGYSHEFARDGNDAVAAFVAGDFALILMDVAMPVCDGFEATLIIRHIEESMGKKRIPIIALTASQERDKCFAVGMDDYLGKPYTVESLQATLERWLN
jgi:CheY-like chemotaxis protein